MVVNLRFRQVGLSQRKIYEIVVIDSRRAKGSGKFIERLGTFHPKIQKINDGSGIEEYKKCFIDRDRIKYWIAMGVQVSPSMRRLLNRANLLPPNPVKVPKDWDRNLWRKEFNKASSYFRQKWKQEE